MFTTIVWATDGSDDAEQALPYVMEFGRQPDASVTIAHVVERVEGAGAVGPPRRADESEFQARLQTMTEQLVREGVKASLEISGEIGVRPAPEIARIARERGADLIVVGTRGRSAVAGVLLGSVAYRLLHLAPCPVLAVPPASARERQARATTRAAR